MNIDPKNLIVREIRVQKRKKGRVMMFTEKSKRVKYRY